MPNGHESAPTVVVPLSVQKQLRAECRIMQGLAQACEHFGTHLPEEGPRTEELLYAVGAQWEKLYEILLRVSGQGPWSKKKRTDTDADSATQGARK